MWSPKKASPAPLQLSQPIEVVSRGHRLPKLYSPLLKGWVVGGWVGARACASPALPHLYTRAAPCTCTSCRWGARHQQLGRSKPLNRQVP